MPRRRGAGGRFWRKWIKWLPECYYRAPGASLLYGRHVVTFHLFSLIQVFMDQVLQDPFALAVDDHHFAASRRHSVIQVVLYFFHRLAAAHAPDLQLRLYNLVPAAAFKIYFNPLAGFPRGGIFHLNQIGIIGFKTKSPGQNYCLFTADFFEFTGGLGIF